MVDRNDEATGGNAHIHTRHDEIGIGLDPFVPTLESWGWLKELRFRFEFAVEVFNAHREFVLPPASRGSRGDDIREAFRRDPLVREAVGATVRTGKPRSIAAADLQIRLVPLFGVPALSRAVIGCLAVAEAPSLAERGAMPARDADRRLDLASQWLAPAIEATIDAAGTSVSDLHTAQRFASMVHVVHALRDVDDDRTVIHLVMDAVALWFDADVRVYRQGLSGSFTLEARLPGAAEQDRPLELPDYGIWDDDEVLPGEHLQSVEGFAWDPRLAGVLLAPIQIDGSPDWLVMVSGVADESIRAILGFLCRGASLCISSRAFAAQDHLRRRIDAMLTTGDPPFGEIVRLALEAAGREIGATASRLALYVNSRTPMLTIGWGRADGEAPARIEPGEIAATAHEIAIGMRVRTGVTAVLEFTRLDGEFVAADMRLAPAAAGQLGSWLAGVFASKADTEAPMAGGAAGGGVPPAPGEPRHPLQDDLKATVPSIKGRGVVVVLVDAAAAALSAVRRDLERQVRASDVVIELPHRGAAAVLDAPDPAAVKVIAARLLRATQERFRTPVRAGVAMSDSSFDSPETVIERAIASARGGEAAN